MLYILFLHIQLIMIWSLSYIYSTYLIPRPLGRSVQSCAHGIWRHGIGSWFHTLAIKLSELQGSNSQLLFNSLGMSQYIYNFINIDYSLTKSTPEHAPPTPLLGKPPDIWTFGFLIVQISNHWATKLSNVPPWVKMVSSNAPVSGKSTVMENVTVELLLLKWWRKRKKWEWFKALQLWTVTLIVWFLHFVLHVFNVFWLL